MKIISQKWAAEMREAMAERRRIDVTTQHAVCIKWLVESLSNHRIPFRLINVGAGVKRVTTDVDVCPKCNGTGKC
jgi:hypothetical protein